MDGYNYFNRIQNSISRYALQVSSWNIQLLILVGISHSSLHLFAYIQTGMKCHFSFQTNKLQTVDITNIIQKYELQVNGIQG